MAVTGFEDRLERLAEVAVRIGVNLRPGQDLLLSTPVAALPLARAIARRAYAAGAGVVTPLIVDDAITRARYEHGREDSFEATTPWLFDGIARAFREGTARLAISGDDPALLAGQDPDRVARAARARSVAYRPVMAELAGFGTNWCMVPAATPAWARTVFPGIPEGEAVARLWDAIFAVTRADAADPVAEWAAHNAGLAARCAALTARRFAALRFRGPGTDLTVGLADGHRWLSGLNETRSGIAFTANVPTEEVFTVPHRERVDGVARSTRPLSHKGCLIQDIEMRFEGGRVVEATARTGADALRRALDTDEGARRLGEVALVPASSPIAATGLLFNETLLDENAASHIALGLAYAPCLEGEGLDGEALAARGANRSAIHVDWMIGSAGIDVDGIDPGGAVSPVMRAGEWA